jgi:hypothetical protein
MSLHIIVTVKNNENKILRRIAELSELLSKQMEVNESIELNNISDSSFKKCVEFCDYYLGIETKDQEAMKKDIVGFMSNKKYSEYTNRINDILQGDYEALFDVMNTADHLIISPLIDVLAYKLSLIMKNPESKIAKLLSQ